MSLESLEQSLWTRLDAQVGGSVVGIYSEVPEPEKSEADAAYPFLTLGPHVASPFDTKEAVGGSCLAQVHIWTRTHDNLARAGLHDAVKAALHRFALPITGAGFSDCRFEGSEGFKDPDGKTYHTVMRFRVTSH